MPPVMIKVGFLCGQCPILTRKVERRLSQADAGEVMVRNGDAPDLWLKATSIVTPT